MIEETRVCCYCGTKSVDLADSGECPVCFDGSLYTQERLLHIHIDSQPVTPDAICSLIADWPLYPMMTRLEAFYLVKRLRDYDNQPMSAPLEAWWGDEPSEYLDGEDWVEVPCYPDLPDYMK